jgi:hypothetical protein
VTSVFYLVSVEVIAASDFLHEGNDCDFPSELLARPSQAVDESLVIGVSKSEANKARKPTTTTTKTK